MESASQSANPLGADFKASSGGGFQRRSSGLIRDFSQADAWRYNVLAMNPVVLGALTLGLVVSTYPHANLWITFLIAGVFCCFEAVVYALFSAAMPRSGGDYVLQSRVLGGGVATFFSFSGITLSQVFTAGIFGFLLSSLILSPFFLLLGAQYNAHWMLSIGEWLGTNWGLFSCAMFVAITGCLVNIRGLRLYAKVQKFAFWPGLVLLLFFIIFVGFSSHATFVGNLNDFMSTHYGVHNAYQATINAGGNVSGGHTVGDTIKASVLGCILLVFPAWSVFQAGEIKRAGSVKSNLYSMLGAEVFCIVVMVVLVFLLEAKVGSRFLHATGNLYFGGTESKLIPVPPLLGFFFAIFGNAPIYTWLLFIMFVSWSIMIYSNAWLAGTRVALAMSFDRILPEWVGKVDRRLHVPVNALLAFSAISVPLAYFYVFQPTVQELTVSFFIIQITCFGVTMLAAVLFPYTRKKLFESGAAAEHKILGLPWLAVAGAIFLAFVVFCDYQALFADELGVNTSKGLLFLVALWATAAVTYGASKVVRRSRGESTSNAYRELPVE